jgi:23S rRNA pseudouridine1911/1915/1917 synthase
VTIASGAIEVKGPPGGKAPAKPKPEGEKPRSERRRAAEEGQRPASAPLPDVAGDVEVVYSDDLIVVANKPAGLTTMRHRAEAAEFGRGKRFLPKTLADILPALLGAPNRPVTAVHRIDRDTSGLVVFARTSEAAAHLTAQFRKHTTDRRYLALTRGAPPAGRIESVFARDRGDGRRGSRDDSTAGEDGRRAVTHATVLEEMGTFALVECRLETGRTHQVRIHLGEAGTPLCGERVYDRAAGQRPVPDGSGADRPMLHAVRLGVAHPESGRRMTWEAPPPADFARLLERLRRNADG